MRDPALAPCVAFCYPFATMRRHASLDGPHTLHRLMMRGLERRVIFTDDGDRADFVARLATLAEAGAFRGYAWALLPTHAHLSGD